MDQVPCLMDFLCVFSVNGSLATFYVRKEGGALYKAELRTSNGQRDDIPTEISLVKSADGWQAQPWHEEVVNSLIQAIERSGS